MHWYSTILFLNPAATLNNTNRVILSFVKNTCFIMRQKSKSEDLFSSDSPLQFPFFVFCLWCNPVPLQWREKQFLQPGGSPWGLAWSALSHDHIEQAEAGGLYCSLPRSHTGEKLPLQSWIVMKRVQHSVCVVCTFAGTSQRKVTVLL